MLERMNKMNAKMDTKTDALIQNDGMYRALMVMMMAKIQNMEKMMMQI